MSPLPQQDGSLILHLNLQIGFRKSTGDCDFGDEATDKAATKKEVKEAGEDSVGTARAMSLRGGAPWHAAIWNESIQLGVLCGLWYFMNVQCAYAFSRLHSIHHTYKVAAVEYVAFLACLVLLRS